MSSGWIIGVYPLLPREGDGWQAGAEEILEACRSVAGFRGFEIPFIDGLHPVDEGWLLGQLREDDQVVITQIPGVVRNLGIDRRYGLASVDPGGRARALDAGERTREALHRVNGATGTSSVRAVLLHSAPGGAGAQAEAFQTSLKSLLGADWGDARLLVEHCDAFGGPTPSKGFLSLSAEIEVLQTLPRDRTGIVVNWARSAIEGNSVDTPLAHLRAARAAGLLSGLMFSGVSDRAESRGGPWADVHLAPSDALPRGDAHSLLDARAICDANDCAAEVLQFRGMKISAPAHSTVEERIRLVRLSAAALF